MCTTKYTINNNIWYLLNICCVSSIVLNVLRTVSHFNFQNGLVSGSYRYSIY